MVITQQQVLDALSNVEEPDLKKDLVTLNMIRDVQIDGNKNLTDTLTKPLPQAKWYPLMKLIVHWVDKDNPTTAWQLKSEGSVNNYVFIVNYWQTINLKTKGQKGRITDGYGNSGFQNTIAGAYKNSGLQFTS